MNDQMELMWIQVLVPVMVLVLSLFSWSVVSPQAAGFSDVNLRTENRTDVDPWMLLLERSVNITLMLRLHRAQTLTPPFIKLLLHFLLVILMLLSRPAGNPNCGYCLSWSLNASQVGVT